MEEDNAEEDYDEEDLDDLEQDDEVEENFEDYGSQVPWEHSKGTNDGEDREGFSNDDTFNDDDDPDYRIKQQTGAKKQTPWS